MLLDRPLVAAATAVTLPLLLLSEGETAARRLIDAAVDVQAGHVFDAALAPQVRAVLAAPGASGRAGPAPDGFDLLDRWVPGLGAEARGIAFHAPPAVGEAIRWPSR